MKKRITALLFAAVMAASVAAVCMAEENPNQATVDADVAERMEKAEAIEITGEFNDEYTWSLATTYSTGTPMVNAYHEFADLMNEYTGGAVTINIFADSSLMGENDSFLSLKSGELEFAGFGPTPFYMYSTDFGFMLAPYMISSYQEYKNLYYSDLVQECVDSWRTEYNTRDLAGMVYRSMRNMSSAKPVNNVDELAGIKLRMNDNQIWADIWNSLGAVTVPMALGELYTGLQQGTVEASEGPWEQMKANNLEEVQDYIIETAHISESVGIWMAEDLYQSLPENYQAAIDKASMIACADMEKEAVEMEDEYKQQLIDGGCEFIVPDLSGFKSGAEECWNKYFADSWTAATLEEVHAIMAGE